MVCADGAAEASRGFHVARKPGCGVGSLSLQSKRLNPSVRCSISSSPCSVGAAMGRVKPFFFFFQVTEGITEAGEVRSLRRHVQWLVEHSVPGCMVGMGACIQMAGAGAGVQGGVPVLELFVPLLNVLALCVGQCLQSG